MLVESSLREGVFDDAQASKAIVEVKSARMLAGAVRCWTNGCLSRLILTGLIEHYRRRLNSVRKPGTQEKGHATLEDTIGIREVLGAIPNEQAREQAKKRMEKARERSTPEFLIPKLVGAAQSRRIKDEPPLLFPGPQKEALMHDNEVRRCCICLCPHPSFGFGPPMTRKTGNFPRVGWPASEGCC